MVLHYCNCLNVKLDLGTQPTALSDVSSLLSEEEKGSVFFKKPEVMLFRLHPSDPVILHPWLLNSRDIGRWTVFHCLNCRTDVFGSAVLDGQKAIVTGTQGIRDSSRIMGLERSDLFSPAFKIVLMAEDCPASRVLPPADPESCGIYQLATEYLKTQESQMLTRIQNFNEEQQSGYLKTQSRVLQERNMLLSLLAAKRNELSFSPSRKSVIPSSADSVPKNSASPRDASSFSSALSKSVSHFGTKHCIARPKDALFDLEGLDSGDEGVESAVEATEEGLSSVKEEGDSDEVHEEGMMIPKIIQANSIAKSLPMCVPPPSAARLVEIDLDATPQDPADIPLSMRAISESIQGDVMWERPRPRLNTMN